MMFLVPLLAGRYGKLLMWGAVALAIVAGYFWWRGTQRAIGAAKVEAQVRREAEAARARMDEARVEYRQDGAEKRLEDGKF